MSITWMPDSFLNQIVVPGLVAIGLYSDDRACLVLATCMAESGLRDTVQHGGGPALGFCQMEPVTHNDLFGRFLGATSREYILEGLRALTSEAGNPQALADCPQYAAAMCAVKYFSVPAPLPSKDDPGAVAAYWKKWYNTPLGAGTVEGFLQRAAGAFNIQY